MSDTELKQFKTEINLTEYAASQGYILLPKERSRNSIAMKHHGGDKVIITRGHDNNWVYFSVRDGQDNGSIIDFVQKRQGGTLGHVRKHLREWINVAPRPAPHLFAEQVEPSTKDRQNIISAWERMKNVDEHPYLKSRAVGKEIISDLRFAGRVKIDQRGNAVFSHYDEQGLCGFEIKNRNFTGFATGGEKGLWLSNEMETDTELVLTESAIDAMSFHALFPSETTRYVSTAGAWSQKTHDLIKTKVMEFTGTTIKLAFDADEQGKIYESMAQKLCLNSGKKIEPVFPALPDTDWNDQLMKRTSIL